MAIYHNEVKVITRGEGRSACAASAYIGCGIVYNNYDGIQHDYTRKQGLVWTEVFLPPIAPAEWKEPDKLWNAVESAEKTKDSRLAREHIVALPIELGVADWKTILTEYIQTQFVSEGMCAQVAVHDTDGHNPIAARWNSEEKLEQQRIAWSECVNKYLEQADREERIDHRSQAERGMDEQLTVREGPAARIVEKQGGIAERCEINRQIKKDNEEIHYWKSVIEKLKKIPTAVVDTIRDLAYKIEEKRQEIITGYYLLAHNEETMGNVVQYVTQTEPILNDYMSNHKKLVTARKEKKALIREYEGLSPIHILKRKELSQQITALDARITKMEKKEIHILKSCGKKNHDEMLALQKRVAEAKTAVQNHPVARTRQESMIRKAITVLKDLFIRTKDYDSITLLKERKAVRVDLELKGTEKIEKAIGKKHSLRIYLRSKGKADETIDKIERDLIEQSPRSKEHQLRAKDTERSAKGAERIA